MKTKGLIKLLVGFTLAASGVFAVGSAVSSKKAESVDAATTTSRLVAKLGNVGKWSQSSAKLCAYLTNDNSEYWTGLQTISSSKTMYVFDYSINFTPTKLIWVRMNPAATSGNWSQKYNQTGDLSFKDATYLPDEWDPSAGSCSQWEITAKVYTSSNSFASPKTSFGVSTVEIVENTHPQVSGVVTLAENEEFKVVNAADNTWSGFYGCPSALNSAFSGGSKTQVEGSGNIKCLIAGTYDFYFDTETKRTWISRQDIVDADGWATYFNSNVGCDATGATLPSGWTSCATAFGNLSSEARNYIYAGKADENGDNLNRALATYDHAVVAHPSLTKFIKNSSNVVRSSNNLVSFNPLSVNNTEKNSIAIIVIISLVAVTGIGGFFFIRKRKYN